MTIPRQGDGAHAKKHSKKEFGQSSAAPSPGAANASRPYLIILTVWPMLVWSSVPPPGATISGTQVSAITTKTAMPSIAKKTLVISELWWTASGILLSSRHCFAARAAT
jgi:hypothetical protein